MRKMEIKEGTLVVILPECRLGIVEEKCEVGHGRVGHTLWPIRVAPGSFRTFKPEELEDVVPLAQTDGTVEDPVEALLQHLPQVVVVHQG